EKRKEKLLNIVAKTLSNSYALQLQNIAALTHNWDNATPEKSCNLALKSELYEKILKNFDFQEKSGKMDKYIINIHSINSTPCEFIENLFKKYGYTYKILAGFKIASTCVVIPFHFEKDINKYCQNLVRTYITLYNFKLPLDFQMSRKKCNKTIGIILRKAKKLMWKIIYDRAARFTFNRNTNFSIPLIVNEFNFLFTAYLIKKRLYDNDIFNKF
ncbi:MAG: hypothetical protein RSE57_02230, partial [Clostridia bacterium]